jgi:hypothetical protein
MFPKFGLQVTILIDIIIGRKVFRSEQGFVRSLFSNIIYNITEHTFGIRVLLAGNFNIAYVLTRLHYESKLKILY